MKKSDPGDATVPLGAGLAGASGGTAFIGLVHLMTDDPRVSEATQYIAPSAAVLISMVWSHILSQMDGFLADRKLAKELKKAEADYLAAYSDPNASDALKTQMRDRVEALRLLKFSIHTKRVEAIVNG